jgi:hypothetical protein
MFYVTTAVHFYEKNGNGTNCLEVIIHPAFDDDMTHNSRFRQVSKCKAKHGNKAVKDLTVKRLSVLVFREVACTHRR